MLSSRLLKHPLPAGVLAIAVVVVFAAALLSVEGQIEIAALVGFAVLAIYLAARLNLTEVVGEAFRRNESAMLLAVLAGFVAVILWFAEDHFPLLLIATVLLYAIVAIGLNVQFGYTGIVNFAGASFFGVGAYTAAVVVKYTSVPHLLALPLGGVVAALVGAALMFPMLRTKGHYTAVVTIAFAILFKTFLEVNDTLGGPQGLRIRGVSVFGWSPNSSLEIGSLEISHYAVYGLAALALAAAAYLLTRRLERSWIGLLMDSVRIDETAAACFGVEIAGWKMLAFTWGNFLAGIAGALYALMVGYIAPNNFTFGDSLILVSIVLIGGIGNLWGAIVASAIVVVLPEKFQVIQEYRFLLYSVLVILLLLFRPQGLLPRRMRAYFSGGGAP
jgi:ABC-type branched-subunit amino acid transport system permease subunit